MAIDSLATEIRDLENQGIAQQDYSIDVTTSKGKTYHRLRYVEGEKRISEVIPEGSVSEWKGLVQRRRMWKQKRRQLDRLQARLSELIEKIQTLGGTV